MKVLLTATVQSHICQFHRPLAEVLHRHGCEVHVAARDNLAEKDGLQLDFADKVYDVPFSRSPKSTQNIKAYKQLKAILANEQYDIIHCNTPMGGIVTRLAARKARKKGTKVYYTAHGFHFYQGAPKKNWLVFYPIEKFFARMTDKLITITKEDYALAKKKFPCEVEYIHGVGANTSRFYVREEDERQAIRKELGIPADTKMLLSIGELNGNKNQKLAIAAMCDVIREIPDAHLFLAGNGEKREDLQALIREYRLKDYITFLGYTTKINQYLVASDLLVACSFREGLPMNLVEAMLCGKPIVASANRGHCELVQEGKNGYLCDPRDPKTFAQNIIRVLQSDYPFGEESLLAARPFKDTSVMEELEAIYQL